MKTPPNIEYIAHMMRNPQFAKWALNELVKQAQQGESVLITLEERIEPMADQIMDLHSKIHELQRNIKMILTV